METTPTGAESSSVRTRQLGRRPGTDPLREPKPSPLHIMRAGPTATRAPREGRHVLPGECVAHPLDKQMHSIPTIAIDSPRFSAAFLSTLPPRAASGSRDDAGEAETPDASRIAYSPATDGSHAHFVSSTGFAVYERDFRKQIDLLKAMYRQLGAHDADEVDARLDLLVAHRFDTPDFFSTQCVIVDGTGKRSLDEFCLLVQHEQIPNTTKQQAIRNLAEGVSACADGAASTLVTAARDLGFAAFGLINATWRTKEACIQAALVECARDHFGGIENYVGDEVHYVNGLRNFLACELGIPTIEDGMAISRMELWVLDDARARALAAIKPENIVATMADRCFDEFLDLLAPASSQSDNTDPEQGITPGRPFAYLAQQTSIEAALTTIRQHYGDQVRRESLLEIDEDNDYQATVRPTSSLLAVDVLEGLAELGLLSTTGIRAGGWVDRDTNESVAVYTFGRKLAWEERHSMNERKGDDTPLFSRSATRGVLNVRHVQRTLGTNPDSPSHGSSAVHYPANRPPWAHAVVQQALLNSDPDDLLNIPPLLVSNGEMAEVLMLRLGARAPHYVDKWGRALPHSLPAEARAFFVDHLMLSGTTEPALLAAWYRDPVALLSEPVDSRSTPRLQSFLSRRAFSGLTMLCEALSAHKTLTNASATETMLALSAPGGPSALHTASRSGDVSTVRAWCAIVIECCTAQRWDSDTLEALLRQVNVMAEGLMAGNADVVRAFGDFLAHPEISPLLGNGLRDTLLAPVIPGIPSLYVALNRGHHAAIEAFFETLQRPELASIIQKDLPAILVAARADGRPAVFDLLLRGQIETLQWYAPASMKLCGMDGSKSAGAHVVHILNPKDSTGRSAYMYACQRAAPSVLREWGNTLCALLAGGALSSTAFMAIVGDVRETRSVLWAHHLDEPMNTHWVTVTKAARFLEQAVLNAYRHEMNSLPLVCRVLTSETVTRRLNIEKEGVAAAIEARFLSPFVAA